MSEEETLEEEEEVKEEVIEEASEERGSEEGETSEEYLPTEEEETSPPTAIDIVGLETMVNISDVLLNAIKGGMSEEEAVKRIKSLKAERRTERRVGRRRRKR